MIERKNLPEAFANHLKTDRGCLPTLFVGLILFVIAPFVVLARSWRAWRRGDGWRIDRIAVPAASSSRFRLVVEADIPNRSAAAFPRRMTDAVVRLAEHLRLNDDVYHHIVRVPAEPEATVLPLGPQIQALGERFALAMDHGELMDRTTLWLTLPATSAISEHIDPVGYDLDAMGEPEGTIERVQPRWAMSTIRMRSGPSVVHRFVFWVPENAVPHVEAIFSRIEG